jgi:hypothetical protein
MSKYGRFGVRLSIPVGSHLVVDKKGKMDERSRSIPAVVVRRGVQTVRALVDIRIMPTSWHTIIYGEMLTYIPNGPVLVRAGESFSFFPAEPSDPCAIYVWEDSTFRSSRETFLADLPGGERTEYVLEPTLGHGYSCSVQVWSDPEPLPPYSGPVCSEIKVGDYQHPVLSKPISERFILVEGKCNCARTCTGHIIGGLHKKTMYGGVVYTIIKNFNQKVRLRPEGVGHYETLCVSRKTLSSWFREADPEETEILEGIPEQFGSLNWDSLHTQTRYKVPEDMNVVRVIKALQSDSGEVVLTHGYLYKRLNGQYSVTLECLNGGPSVEISFERARDHLEAVKVACISKQEFESTRWTSHPDCIEMWGGFLTVNGSDKKYAVTKQEDGSFRSPGCPLGTCFRVSNCQLRFLDGGNKIFHCSHAPRTISGRAEVVELGPQGTGSFTLGSRPKIRQIPAFLRHITDAFPTYNRWEVYRGTGTNLGIHKEIIPSMRASCGRIMIPFFHEKEKGTVLVSRNQASTTHSQKKDDNDPRSGELDYFQVRSGTVLRTKAQQSYGFIGSGLTEWVLLVGYNVSVPPHPFVDWDYAAQSSESSGEEVNDEDLLINSIVGCVTYHDSPKWWIRDILGPPRDVSFSDGKPKLCLSDSIAWRDTHMGLTDCERSLIMLVGVFLANKNRHTVATAVTKSGGGQPIDSSNGVPRKSKITLEGKKSEAGFSLINNSVVEWLTEQVSSGEDFSWLVDLWDIFTQNPTASFVRPSEFSFSRFANMSSYCRGQSFRVQKDPVSVIQGIICLAAKRKDFRRIQDLWKFDPLAMLQCVRDPARPMPKRGGRGDGADRVAISFVEGHFGHPWWNGFLSPLPADVVSCARRVMNFLLNKSERITVTVTLYSYWDVMQDTHVCSVRRGAVISDIIIDLIGRNLIIGSEQDPSLDLSETVEEGQYYDIYGSSTLEGLGYVVTKDGGWSVATSGRRNTQKAAQQTEHRDMLGDKITQDQVDECNTISQDNNRVVEMRYKEFLRSQIEEKRAYLQKCPYDTPIPGPVLEATSVSTIVAWGDASILVPTGKSFSVDGVDISGDGEWPEIEGCITSAGPKLLSMGRFNRGAGTVVSHHGSIAVKSGPSSCPVIVPEGSVVKTGPHSEVLCLDNTSITVKGLTRPEVTEGLRINISRSAECSDILFGAGVYNNKPVIKCGKGNSSVWLKEASALEAAISAIISDGQTDIAIGIIDTRKHPRHGELGSWVESICRIQGYPVTKDDRPAPDGLGNEKSRGFRGPIDEMLRYHLQGTSLSSRYPVFPGTLKTMEEILRSGEISKNRLSRLAVKGVDASAITYESSWSDILTQATQCKRSGSSEKIPVSPVTRTLISLFLGCFSSPTSGTIQKGISTCLISASGEMVDKPTEEVTELVFDDQFKGYVSIREGSTEGFLEKGKSYVQINNSPEQVCLSLFGLRTTGSLDGQGLLVSQGNVDNPHSVPLTRTGFSNFQIPVSTHMRRNRVFVKVMPGGWISVRCNAESNKDGSEKTCKELRASAKRRKELITTSQKQAEVEAQVESQRRQARIRKSLFQSIESRASDLGAMVVDHYERAVLAGTGDTLCLEDFTATGIPIRPTIMYDGDNLHHPWCDRIRAGFPVYSLLKKGKGLFSYTAGSVSLQSAVNTLSLFHGTLTSGVTRIPSLSRLTLAPVRAPRIVSIMKNDEVADHVSPAAIAREVARGGVKPARPPQDDNYLESINSDDGLSTAYSDDFLDEYESDSDHGDQRDLQGNSLWEPIKTGSQMSGVRKMPEVKNILSSLPSGDSALSAVDSASIPWWTPGPRLDVYHAWGGTSEGKIGSVKVPPSDLSELEGFLRDSFREMETLGAEVGMYVTAYKRGAKALWHKDGGGIFIKGSKVFGVVLQGDLGLTVKSRSLGEEKTYTLGSGTCFYTDSTSHPIWSYDMKVSKKCLVVATLGDLVTSASSSTLSTA